MRHFFCCNLFEWNDCVAFHNRWRNSCHTFRQTAAATTTSCSSSIYTRSFTHLSAVLLAFASAHSYRSISIWQFRHGILIQPAVVQSPTARRPLPRTSLIAYLASQMAPAERWITTANRPHHWAATVALRSTRNWFKEVVAIEFDFATKWIYRFPTKFRPL